MGKVRFKKGTKFNYEMHNAQAYNDPDILYFIDDTREIYRGTALMASRHFVEVFTNLQKTKFYQTRCTPGMYGVAGDDVDIIQQDGSTLTLHAGDVYLCVEEQGGSGHDPG